MQCWIYSYFLRKNKFVSLFGILLKSFNHYNSIIKIDNSIETVFKPEFRFKTNVACKSQSFTKF